MSETDLAAWLGQCIDEDQRVADAALARVRKWNRLNVPWLRARRVDPATRAADEMLLAVWDPERVLAECDAKRRIIAFATSNIEDGLRHANSLIEGEYDDDLELPSRLLRLMAVVYKERDGYRAEWSPDGR